MNTVESIQEYIKADSLEYLSHDGMMAAVNEGVIPPAAPGAAAAAAGGAAAAAGGKCGTPDSNGHCSACMTGVYPVEFDP